MRKCLLDMNAAGVLRVKYIIENNTELQDKVIFMVKQDNIAQWLAGNELKRDQFKFLYDSIKVINESALKDLLLNEDKKVVQVVIP